MSCVHVEFSISDPVNMYYPSFRKRLPNDFTVMSSISELHPGNISISKLEVEDKPTANCKESVQDPKV